MGGVLTVIGAVKQINEEHGKEYALSWVNKKIKNSKDIFRRCAWESAKDYLINNLQD